MLLFELLWWFCNASSIHGYEENIFFLARAHFYFGLSFALIMRNREQIWRPFNYFFWTYTKFSRSLLERTRKTVVLLNLASQVVKRTDKGDTKEESCDYSLLVNIWGKRRLYVPKTRESIWRKVPPLLFETKRWSVHLSSDIFYFFLYFLKKKVKILQKSWRCEDACYILHGNGRINIPKLSFVWMTFSQYLVCEEQWYFSHFLKCMIQLNLFFFFFYFLVIDSGS